MDWDVIIRNWENEDLIKIILSLIAGLLLGIEREVKDKAAGFKNDYDYLFGKYFVYNFVF